MNGSNNNGRNVHNNMQSNACSDANGRNTQPQRPDSENISGLLNAVSKKLNIPPDRLRAELEQGKFDNALKNMSPQDAEKFNAAIKQPKIIEQMMSTPQAQALYKKLSGGK